MIKYAFQGPCASGPPYVNGGGYASLAAPALKVVYSELIKYDVSNRPLVGMRLWRPRPASGDETGCGPCVRKAVSTA